jgi:hypothetical protein
MKTAPKRINQRKTRTLEPFRRKTTGQTPSSQTVFAGVQLGEGDARTIGILQNPEDFQDWSNWEPVKDTLIVIDYVYRFSSTYKAMQKRFQALNRLKPIGPRVRVLLLDHIWSPELEYHTISTSKDRYMGDVRLTEKEVLYQKEPLRLADARGRDDMLHDIIVDVAELDLTNHDHKIISWKASSKLRRMGYAARQPLFAVLIAFMIKSDKMITELPYWEGLGRTQLIEYYLSRKNRKPWLWQDQGIGIAVSTMISAATLSKGCSYSLLCKLILQPLNQINNFEAIRAHCQQIVSDTDNNILKHFEPDIIGETFFFTLR